MTTIDATSIQALPFCREGSLLASFTESSVAIFQYGQDARSAQCLYNQAGCRQCKELDISNSECRATCSLMGLHGLLLEEHVRIPRAEIAPPYSHTVLRQGQRMKNL